MKKSPSLSRITRRKNMRPQARNGFSLIEIMVVLVIASIVVSVSVRGFSSMKSGNNRTSCQTNLVQIYNGLRLYMSDSGNKVPSFNIDGSNKHVSGIGLWELYTFPDPSSTTRNVIAPVDSLPTSRYIRNVRALHCPSDEGITPGDTSGLTHDSLYTDDTKKTYNPAFNSYGEMADTNLSDNEAPSPDPSKDVWPYWPARAGASTEHLLLPRAVGPAVPVLPSDDTVVTWCRYHRAERDYDEVLFFDGTVRYLPRLQQVTPATSTSPALANGGTCTAANGTDCLQGADRVPYVSP